MSTRQQIIDQHVQQEDLFKILRLAFCKMVKKEQRFIRKLRLRRPVNATVLDNLAVDMDYLQSSFRLVKR